MCNVNWSNKRWWTKIVTFTVLVYYITLAIVATWSFNFFHFSTVSIQGKKSHSKEKTLMAYQNEQISLSQCACLCVKCWTKLEGSKSVRQSTGRVWSSNRPLLLPATQTRAKIQSWLTAKSSSRWENVRVQISFRAGGLNSCADWGGTATVFHFQL